MNYEKFCTILNKHIFEGEKKELLKKLADRPERFIGLFRPTKPGTKILQHLLQSHEIKFGDALEELVDEFIKEFGFEPLDKNIRGKDGQSLTLDQYFKKNSIAYFVEQKVRDDHDSTKKRGQVANFEAKLEALYEIHGDSMIAVMYFIDPDLMKNKNFYAQEIERLSSFYGIKIYLLYGREFFDFLEHSNAWNQVLSWLKQWKDSLPEIPDINFDKDTKKSFEEIKILGVRHWRKLLENEKLWEEEIIKAIFKRGDVLRMILEFFNSESSTPYKHLAKLLEKRLESL